MSKKDIPQFTNGLESLNTFFALPAFWQPIIVASLRVFIEEGYIKTQAELVELQRMIDILPADASESEIIKAYSALRRARNINLSFATFVLEELANVNDTLLSTFNHLHSEHQENVIGIILSSEYKLLQMVLADIQTDTREELMHAWAILDVYISRSDEERDAIAEDIRNNKTS